MSNSAQTAIEVHKIFTERFQERDLDGIIALFEPDAVLMPHPGQIVKGHSAIRDALAGFMAIDGRFEMELSQELSSGELSLLHSVWSLNGTTPDGNDIHLGARTSDVVRRQTDGSWLYVIDNPWG